MILPFRSILVGLLMCGLVVAVPTRSFCSSLEIEDSSPQETVAGIANKAARGVTNVATGWLELPKQIVLTYKEDGAAKGIFIGPLMGVGMMLVRTVSGVIETATFFVPYPGFYDPLMEPAYVWQKE